MRWWGRAWGLRLFTGVRATLVENVKAGCTAGARHVDSSNSVGVLTGHKSFLLLPMPVVLEQSAAMGFASSQSPVVSQDCACFHYRGFRVLLQLAYVSLRAVCCSCACVVRR
jgi:hypothetical protein